MKRLSGGNSHKCLLKCAWSYRIGQTTNCPPLWIPSKLVQTNCLSVSMIWSWYSRWTLQWNILTSQHHKDALVINQANGEQAWTNTWSFSSLPNAVPKKSPLISKGSNLYVSLPVQRSVQKQLGEFAHLHHRLHHFRWNGRSKKKLMTNIFHYKLPHFHGFLVLMWRIKQFWVLMGSLNGTCSATTSQRSQADLGLFYTKSR